MIDFTLAPELEALRGRVTGFIRDDVIPSERAATEHDGLPAEQLAGLRAKARALGIYAPHVEREWGGLGLDLRSMSVLFEAAGRSLLGPLALNCSAPDEGNMHLIELIATDAQKERYLRPLVAGSIRSCFAMTEPPPGAGADPAMLRTRAVRSAGGWTLDGDKWYITGADGAAFAIVMARSGEDAAGRPHATMFLVDTENPGFRVVRRIPSLDEGIPGGHCEVEIRDCVVGDDAVLGAVDEGFAYAQARLAPARLTHCMRWLGVAQRAQEIAADYANSRESFGAPLGNHQMVQAMLADSAMELHASRLMIWHAAWALDTGGSGHAASAAARHETSIAKTYVAETVNRVVDRALQICGSHGVSEDLPLASFYRAARPFRIYDGPSEVHRMVIARDELKAAARRAAEVPSQGGIA
ncbi:MAG: acyl-CoA dehydrogenase family protein [Ktedonobacterales bacterium]